MEYKPYGFNAGSTNIASEELLVGSTLSGEAIDVTNVRLAVDFKCRRSNQKLNKYVGVAKARYKNGSAWSAGSTYPSGSGNQRWLDVINGSPYHPGTTFWFAQNLGLPEDQACGIMYVTYYVWFKTQRLDT